MEKHARRQVRDAARKVDYDLNQIVSQRISGKARAPAPGPSKRHQASGVYDRYDHFEQSPIAAKRRQKVEPLPFTSTSSTKGADDEEGEEDGDEDDDGAADIVTQAEIPPKSM
ncbi:hypothetical protein BGX31_000583 [Mortierella sp. GBA43]|nr:hypothetical protein BGX31_000583 [Mortierella sp. GBA43]